MSKWPLIFCFITLPLFCRAQNPLSDLTDGIQSRFSDRQPVIDYTLSVDTGDLSVVTVQLKLENVGDTFRLAMYAHPLADDKYWRHVEDLTVNSDRETTTLFREDSAVWKITTHDHRATVFYKVRLSQLTTSGNSRSSARPFLSGSGGLVGDYHIFMYVVGQTLAPSFVHLRIPGGWQIATGLEPTADPFTFYASSAGILMDAPILIGHFREWQFQVGGVPHTVAYWSLANASPFDTITFVSDIQKIVTQACNLFGRLPYREYFFLLQDGSYGALEHNNSVTVGIPSKELAENVAAYNGEIAHEYFHAWNMLRIYPVEYSHIDYKPPPLSKSLWWSEGLTMFYADLLLRRAGIAADTSTRVEHLVDLIERYFNNPGNHTFSAEKVSMSDVAPPGYLGDYFASTHLQGEIIGNLLDMVIRNATDGQRSVDDLMRSMFENFGGEKGFTGKEVELLTDKICNCKVHSFFENYIRGNKVINFNEYLSLLGLKMSITKTVLLGDDKKPAPDESVFAWNDRAANTIKLGITDPQGCWGRAGLHTGDVIIKIGGAAVSSVNDFYSWLDKLKVGDTASIEVQRRITLIKTKVPVTDHQLTLIKIERMPGPSAKRERLYAEWIIGK
jgi:predicted metalloprotease with PDZ domain